MRSYGSYEDHAGHVGKGKKLHRRRGKMQCGYGSDQRPVLCGCQIDPGSLQPGEKPAFDAEDIRGLSGISQCEEENGKVPGGVNKCIFE